MITIGLKGCSFFNVGSNVELKSLHYVREGNFSMTISLVHRFIGAN